MNYALHCLILLVWLSGVKQAIGGKINDVLASYHQIASSVYHQVATKPFTLYAINPQFRRNEPLMRAVKVIPGALIFALLLFESRNQNSE